MRGETLEGDSMKKTTWSLRLVFVFGAIIVASIVTIILILTVYKPTKDSISFEIVKSLLQILTVLILGQVISLVVTQLNLNRQRAEASTDFQREILRRLISAYVSVKKYRRLLRAKGLVPPYIGEIQENTVVRLDAYDSQMQLINETELEIETIRHEVECSPTTFSDSKLLVGNLKRMEDYLRDLVQLYERKLSAFSGEPPSLPIADLNLLPESSFALSDFVVGKGKKGGFILDFSESYYKVSKSIREDILK